MKLNLASGTDLRPHPWVNLDIVHKWPLASRSCDVIWDARKDRIPYPDNSVDEIYAGYLLLHLSPVYHKQVLAEIYRVAMPGCPVVFGEVDMNIVMRRWLDNPNDQGVSWLIWGEQGEAAHGTEYLDYDSHRWGFTESKLRNVLTEAGFRSLQRIQIHASGVYYELTMSCVKP